MDKKIPFTFAAIDPYVESNIVSPKEKKVGGKEYIIWGDSNRYPDYLQELYDNCTTLRSVINGMTDYVGGNGVQCIVQNFGRYANRKRMTMHELVRVLASNNNTYGGFAVQVIRNGLGEIVELYPINVRFLRSDKEGELFWYSEKWTGMGGNVKAVQYPKFMPGSMAPASILYYKGTVDTTYPQPVWAAAVKSCEVERSIDEFHLNSISNGFMGSYIVNFNNGTPEPEIQEEIEKNFTEKFAGKQNAGRIMFSWNATKESAATLQKMEIADYGDKYSTLAKHCRQQIYAAFRANPNLFGIATESSGFNSEEYSEAFKLFNRTMVRPVQQSIVYAMDHIFGVDGSITIQPFSIENENETTVQ